MNKRGKMEEASLKNRRRGDKNCIKQKNKLG
jgi:hypothetical protein